MKIRRVFDQTTGFDELYIGYINNIMISVGRRNASNERILLKAQKSRY